MAELLNYQVRLDARQAKKELDALQRPHLVLIKTDADTGRAETQLDTLTRPRLADINADADTTKAETQLDLAARPRLADINADADTARAEAQLDLAARPRSSTINARLDNSFTGLQNKLAGLTKIKSLGASGVEGEAAGISALGGSALSTGLAVGGLAVAVGSLALAGKGLSEFRSYASDVSAVANATGLAAEQASEATSVFDRYGFAAKETSAILLKLQSSAAEGKFNLDPGANAIENLKKIADQYVKLKTDAEKAKFATEVFGARRAARITPIIKGGSAGVEQKIGEVSGGKILSDKDLSNARELSKTVTLLKQEISGVLVGIGAKVAPFFTDLVDAIKNVFNALDGIGAIDALASTFELAVAPLRALVKILKGDFKGALDIIDSAVAKFGKTFLNVLQGVIDVADKIAGPFINFGDDVFGDAQASLDKMAESSKETDLSTPADDAAALNEELEAGATEAERLADAAQKINDALNETIGGFASVTDAQQAQVDALQAAGELSQQVKDAAAGVTGADGAPVVVPTQFELQNSANDLAESIQAEVQALADKGEIKTEDIFPVTVEKLGTLSDALAALQVDPIILQQLKDIQAAVQTAGVESGGIETGPVAIPVAKPAVAIPTGGAPAVATADTTTVTVEADTAPAEQSVAEIAAEPVTTTVNLDTTQATTDLTTFKTTAGEDIVATLKVDGVNAIETILLLKEGVELLGVNMPVAADITDAVAAIAAVQEQAGTPLKMDVVLSSSRILAQLQQLRKPLVTRLTVLAPTLNTLLTRLSQLTSRVQNVRIKYTELNRPPGFWQGGNVKEGKMIEVAERGPEMFIGNSGTRIMLDSPTFWRPPEAGRILSAPATKREVRTMNKTMKRTTNYGGVTINVSSPHPHLAGLDVHRHLIGKLGGFGV